MVTMWLCRCDCGEERSVYARNLVSGSARSCGCLKREKSAERMRGRGHGMTGTRTYGAWRAAKERTTNPRNKKYADYGGRGIKMCAHWLESFEAFHADMGDAPDGTELERDDVNGHYAPGNCRWATRSEQMLNRRATTTVIHGGRELSLRDFSRTCGIAYQTIVSRVGTLGLRGRRGVDSAEILSASRDAYLRRSRRTAANR